MDKNKITLVRVVTTAALIFLNVLILVFLVGGSEFQGIINTLSLTTENNIEITSMISGEYLVYNLYYYIGLNFIYRILFSITLLVAGYAIVAIFYRISGAGKAAIAANILMISTGVFLLVARILEGVSGIHVFITKIYLNGINGKEIETVQMLDRFPIIYVLLIIVGIFGLIMVRSSKIIRLKAFNKAEERNASACLIPATIAVVFHNCVRIAMIGSSASNMDSVNQISYDYLMDYLINTRLLLNMPWVYLIVLGVILAVVYKNKKMLLSGLVSIGIPTLIAVIIAIYHFINPVKLFGYITSSVDICDTVDACYLAYLVSFVLVILITNALVLLIVNNKISTKKICIALIINVIISVAGILISVIAHKILVPFIVCIIADLIMFIIAVLGVKYRSQQSENS